MVKRLAADNGQKQSGEGAVEQEWEWGVASVGSAVFYWNMI